MFAVSLLLFIIIVSLLDHHKSSVIVCNSTSCAWNKLCRCTRREISVYDNTVKGLCLQHTEGIKERILDPMQEKRIIESDGDSEFGKKVIDKIMKMQEEKLLKDPDAFARWMDKAFRKRQTRRKE